MRPEPPTEADRIINRGLRMAAAEGLTARQLRDRYYAAVLTLAGGNRAYAARRLGVHRRRLYDNPPTTGDPSAAADFAPPGSGKNHRVERKQTVAEAGSENPTA